MLSLVPLTGLGYRLVSFRILSRTLEHVKIVIILLRFYLIAPAHSADPFKPPCWAVTEQTNFVECNERNATHYVYRRASAEKQVCVVTRIAGKEATSRDY